MKPGTDAHSNTAEGVPHPLKPGATGTFHSVSRKHPQYYLDEFQFCWNTRKTDDSERAQQATKAAQGKRLEHQESVENPPYEAP